MKINDPDYNLLQFMRNITNDMEGVTPNLPPFARFEDEGMTADDVATILVALEQHYHHKIDVPFYPECLMDICDIVQGRPRELDSIRQQQHTTLYPYRQRVPLWKKILQKGHTLKVFCREFLRPKKNNRTKRT